MDALDYLALSGPEPTAKFSYGNGESEFGDTQFAELFMPSGEGPFPVAVLVHGGGWLKENQGLTQLRDMAGALVKRNIAVWNVEYRCVDEPGGGYPGMYNDVADAMDLLKTKAGHYRLDLCRVVAIGHSAGAHLAQWLAARARIPTSSPLFRPDIVPVKHVINLGGIADVRGQARMILNTSDRSTKDLCGSPSESRPDVFSDTNPGDLIPNGGKTVLITGDLDDISPPEVALAFAERVRAAGDEADVIILPGAGHYDAVSSQSSVWGVVAGKIEEALALAPAP